MSLEICEVTNSLERSQENTDEIYEREFLEKAIAANKAAEQEKAQKDKGDSSVSCSDEKLSDSSNLDQFVENPNQNAEERAEFFGVQFGLTLKQRIRRRSSVRKSITTFNARRASFFSGVQRLSIHGPDSQKNDDEAQKLVSTSTDEKDEENLFTARKFMNNPNPISKGISVNVDIIEDWKSHPMSALIKNSASNSNRESNVFVTIWTRIMIATHTYNFFTSFFFLGIAGFPSHAWLLLEAAAEVILIFDFILRIVLRHKFPDIWKTIQMISDQKAEQNRFYFLMALIASVPQSIILNYSLLADQTTLSMLPIAIARCFKLFQMRQVQRYFEIMDLTYRRKSSESTVNTAKVVYYLTLFVHWVSCLWLLVNRIDPEVPDKGWYKMDNLSHPHSMWDEYLDSLFWCHAQMSGVGFGNVVPSSNLEWVVCSCIEVFGASIYFGIYSDIATEVYMRNQIAIANQKMEENAKQFALVRKIPTDIAIRIKQYYQFMRVRFDEFKTKQNLLTELPTSLKSELTLIFNSQLIQSVNFFQLADPAFILTLTMKCIPQICIVGDFVFKADDMADNLYFILQGQVEILGKEHETPLAYQSKGSYFGEIGVLLTGVRTASVRIILTSILFYIEKTELVPILDQYPKQAKFLRAVGRQRVQTTPSHRVRGLDEAVQELQRMHSLQVNFLGDIGEMYAEKKQAIKRIGSLNLISPEDEEKEFMDQKLKYKNQEKKGLSLLSESKTKPWLTSRSPQVNYFVIVPFSLIFNVWNFILVAAVSFYTFIIPFNIALNQNINQYINVPCQIILMMDMPIRAVTAVTKSKSICFDQTELLKYYVNTWLVIDFIATIPLDLILIGLESAEIIRWIFILKLLKLMRVQELSEILKSNSSINSSVATLIQLFFYIIICCHFAACVHILISQYEYNRCARFDCKTMFWSINMPSFAIQGPMETLAPLELYGQMWYYAGDLIMCATFGDVVPYAPSEIIWSCIIMLVGRILIAFVCAEFSSYLEGQYASIEEYTTKVNFLKRWMAKSGFPDSLIKRVTKYHAHIWKDLRGVNDRFILDDLPQTLRQEIRIHLFGAILTNWEVLEDIKNQGIRTALISKFELVMYPKGEYVIRINEIAQEMYFIIQGRLEVRSADGTPLVQLLKGQHFGEMALLDPESNSRRGASIVSMSKVTLALLKLSDFQLICRIYPEFDARIREITEERKNPKGQEKFKKAIITKIFKLTKQKSNKSSVNDDGQSQRSSITQKSMRKYQDSRDFQKEKMYNATILNMALATDQLQVPTPRLAINEDLRLSPKRNKSTNDVLTTKSPNQEKKIAPEPIKEDDVQSTTSKMSTLMKKMKTNQMKIKELQLRSKFGSVKPEEVLGRQVRTLENHFQSQPKFHEQTRKCQKKCSNKRNWMRGIITTLSFYNLVFVPLQFAFRLEYNNGILFMEIITIVFYLVDAYLRWKTLRNIIWVLGQKRIDLENMNDFKNLAIFDQQPEQIKVIQKQQQTEIICDLVACLPFGCLFSAFDFWSPWYIVNFYCSLRIVKIRPVFVMFEYLRATNLNVWRAIEVIFYYYIITHYWSCMMVSSAGYEADTNLTWLQKVPYPPTHGPWPPQNNFFKETSFWTAYIHAFYFLASSYSHVNIGDVTPINLMEKFCMPFIMITGTYMYYLLYSNIVAMVASLGSTNKIKFEAEFNILKQKLQNGKTPKREIDNVNQYLDYILAIFDGLDEQQFLAELPFSIKSDILLSRFTQAIEQGILFKDDNSNIDITLCNSAFSMMKIKFFMKDQFILRLGEHTTDTIIVLDGKVNVFGCHTNEFLGYLPAGYHYANDLGNDTRKSQYTGHLGEELLRTDFELGDNLENKCLVHLVAKSFVVIGVLSQEERNQLYNAYPDWKRRMQCLNHFLFEVGLLSLEKATEKAKRDVIRPQCLTVLENNITYSTQTMYETFLEEFAQLRIDFKTNLSSKINDFFTMNYMDKDEDPIRLLQKMKIMATNIVDINSEHFLNPENFNDEGHAPTKFKCYLEVRTNLMQCLQLIQFINLLYCAFLIPFHIGFNLEMTTLFIYLEGCSLLISLFFFFLTFRIPVIVHREKTLNCGKVALHYWQKDMIFDLLGLCPLNLFLGIYYNNTIHSEWWVIFVAILRVLRVVQIFKMIEIFSNFQAHFKIPELATNLFKTFLVFMILNHLAVCAWMYTVFVLEPEDPKNWLVVMGLQDSGIGQQYLRSFYLVQNIVTTTGSGDVYGCTDLERCFFVGLITGGDILFSLAFGFIQNLTRMSASNSEDKQFVDKIVRIESYMDEYKMSSKQKKRVEEYFAYAFVQKKKLSMLDREHLFQKLPTCLAKEIFYHNFKDDLNKMFEEFGSENFVRDLCSKLNVLIFLPGDYVIERGTIGREMYFVCDGLVNQIAVDNKTWVGRFFVGDYFGELGILFETKRTFQMQAQTFCLLNELKKTDLDEVSKSYPKVAEGLKSLAEEKMQMIAEFKHWSSFDRNQLKFGGVIDGSAGENTQELATFDFNGSMFSESDEGKKNEHPKVKKGLLNIVDQSANLVSQNTSSGDFKPQRTAMFDHYLLAQPAGQPTTSRDASRKDSSVADLPQGQDVKQASIEDIYEEHMLKKKTKRRLSGISLGKTLKLSQKTGLKLNWAIEN